MTRAIHIVSSLCHDGGGERGVQTLVEEGFYDVFDHFHIAELVRDSDVSGIARERIKKHIGNRMIALTDKCNHQRVSMKETPLLIKKLHTVFRTLKPDAVILSGASSQFVGRWAAMPHPKIKVVDFHHNTFARNRAIRLALLATSWRSDAVFGDTVTTIKANQDDYTADKPSYHVPLRVLETGKLRSGQKPAKIKIVSLGRLASQKNYQELILGVAQLMGEGHNLELTIAGEGEERQRLEDLVSNIDKTNSALAFAHRIHLPGHISDATQLQSLFNDAHLYAQCSHHEGFCIATAEALAAGLPVAATNFAGVQDYGNSRNIRIIPSPSHRDIAATLRDIIDNYSEVVPQMSAAALETTENRFTRTAVRAQWKLNQNELLSPRISPSILSAFRAIPNPGHPFSTPR